MHHCPECGSYNMDLVHEAGVDRQYKCRDCEKHTKTIELPASEVRRLVLASLELQRLEACAVL